MTVVNGDRRRNDWNKMQRGLPSVSQIEDSATRRALQALYQRADYADIKMRDIHKPQPTEKVTDITKHMRPINRQFPSVSMISAIWDEATGATLKGYVNPNGATTTYYFQYMRVAFDQTTGTYPDPDFAGASVTPTGNAGAVSVAVEETEVIAGLTVPGHYYVQLVATNLNGTAFSDIISFDACNIPDFTLDDPTEISSTGFKMNGTVNPKGLTTTYHFEYGTTPDCGTSTTDASAGDGVVAVTVSASISGLATNAKIYFRLVVQNACGRNGDKDANDRANSCSLRRSDISSTLTLQAHSPDVVTQSDTDRTDRSFTMNGTVDPNTFPTTYYFEWGLTQAYGNTTTVTSAGTGDAAVAAVAAISGLTPDTVYVYRIVATNANGTAYGAAVSVTTNAPEVTLTGSLAYTTLFVGDTGTEVKIATVKNSGDNPSTLKWTATLTLDSGLAIAMDVSSGELAYNAEASINLTLTKTGMVAGTYAGTLSVTDNTLPDPITAAKTLAITLTVYPLYAGDIKAQIDETDGGSWNRHTSAQGGTSAHASYDVYWNIQYQTGEYLQGGRITATKTWAFYIVNDSSTTPAGAISFRAADGYPSYNFVGIGPTPVNNITRTVAIGPDVW